MVDQSRCSRAQTQSLHSRQKGAKFGTYVGTWNVRTFLDNEGTLETVRQGRDGL